MKKKLMISCAILLFLIFIPNIVLAQTGTTTVTAIPNQAIDNKPLTQEYLLEFQRDMFNQVSDWNSNYLLFILGVVTLLMGGLWFFNLKPSKEAIDKSEEKRKKDFRILSEKLDNNIKSSEDKFVQANKELQDVTVELKKESGLEIEAAKKIINTIKIEADKKQKELENKFKHLELDLIWNEFETADLNKDDVMMIFNLIGFLERSIEYKITYLMSVAMTRLIICLNSLSKTDIKDKISSFKKDNYLSARINKILLDLEKNPDLKGKIENFETTKNKIITMLKEISEIKEETMIK